MYTEAKHIEDEGIELLDEHGLVEALIVGCTPSTLALIEVAPAAIDALKDALAYIGAGEDDECPVCGGNGTTLEYHRSCPCRNIRPILKTIQAAIAAEREGIV